MARPHGYGAKVIMALLDEFPNTPSLTLAKLAYKRHPELWTSVETARTKIRDFRGACGEKMRNKLTVKEYFRERRSPSVPVFGKAFVPKEPLDWHPVCFDGPARVLVISDCHIPYFDAAALNACVDYGIGNKADTILLNGDICDFFAVSWWQRDPRERDFQNEINQTVHFFTGIRKAFPKAKIIWKLGNHEERMENYMMVKAPELLGLDCLEIGQLFNCAEFKIQIVKDKMPMRFGKLNIIHGHEYKFAISNPVMPARGLFQRAHCYCMSGHFHRPSYYPEPSLEQNTIACWTTGCLCQTHPEWLPINKWMHGFAFVTVEKDGTFSVDNKVIKGGKPYPA